MGVGTYKSKTQGIGGRIKEIPEDFVVEEITPEGWILEVDKAAGKVAGEEGEYVHVTLQKRDWSTLRAVKELSKRLAISRKRIGFAGTKDKRAVTTQKISVWNKTVEDLMKVELKDIVLRDYSYSDMRINLGDLSGNRFTIKLRDVDLTEKEIRDRIDKINIELKSGFPNFFGVQRFGTKRPITHLVGREMLKGNFKEAVYVYLCMEFPDESEELREARISLRETEDYRQAVRDFPRRLEYEHSLLNYLIRNENDYVGALRQLPPGLSKMFVHAYQSYIFNKALSFYLTEEIPVERLPLVGYRSEIDEVSEKILERENISVNDFILKGAPELGSKGNMRDAFAVYEDFSVVEIDLDDLFMDKRIVKLTFRLSKGCYATSLLREFMKN